MNKAVPLSLRKSFGFGDRLGVATPGHIAAVKNSSFTPIFAQQSIRELQRCNRTPEDVMSRAQSVVDSTGWSSPWGADADHLKTLDQALWMAGAGFTFFTIDPSDHVQNDADQLSLQELSIRIDPMIREGVWKHKDELDQYVDQTHEVADGLVLKLSRENLYRAAVKYGRAIRHASELVAGLRLHPGSEQADIEISVDETATPTSHEEHLLWVLELKRRGVTWTSLAPRFPGEFEKGIDYKGDLKAFEASLKVHAAIAQWGGPYKMSIHSGSDKFSIYPIISKVCGDLLHLKTSGTSYLEALRVVAKASPQLFKEIIQYALTRFDEDRRSYHLSTTLQDLKHLSENWTSTPDLLNRIPERQLLHVTFGSVLSAGKDSKGQAFKEQLMECLNRNPDLYQEYLVKHFDRHIRPFEVEVTAS